MLAIARTRERACVSDAHDMHARVVLVRAVSAAAPVSAAVVVAVAVVVVAA